jgi:hypothetical protein
MNRPLTPVIIASSFLVASVLLVVFVFIPSVDGHYLLKPAQANGKEIAAYESGYFTYLASLTGAVVAGLFALLEFDDTQGSWRESLPIALVCLLIGLALVTSGYAIRNLWFVGNKGLPIAFAYLDAYVMGPITATAYFVSLIYLIAALSQFFHAKSI